MDMEEEAPAAMAEAEEDIDFSFEEEAEEFGAAAEEEAADITLAEAEAEEAAEVEEEAVGAEASQLGLSLVLLEDTPFVDVTVDGADEVDPELNMIKGGGGALTREKIVAAASKTFVCIADQSKQVNVLGAYPLPLEVIPLARSLVARKMVALGGQPEWREGFTTDNGNWILDVHNLDLVDPVSMEKTINNIPGVVTCGLFALRPADLVLMSTESGIRQL